MWPPSLVRIRIVENGRKKHSLWLPTILIWPVVLALAIAFAPLVVPIGLLLWRKGGKVLLLAGPLVFYLFCSLRGLSVRVQGSRKNIRIRFW